MTVKENYSRPTLCQKIFKKKRKEKRKKRKEVHTVSLTTKYQTFSRHHVHTVSLTTKYQTFPIGLTTYAQRETACTRDETPPTHS